MLLAKCTQKGRPPCPHARRKPSSPSDLLGPRGSYRRHLILVSPVGIGSAVYFFLPAFCSLLQNLTYFTIWLLLSPLTLAACRRPQLRPVTVQIVSVSIEIECFISISLEPVNNIKTYILFPGAEAS